MPDGVRQPRQYSLTRADDGEHRQFSVKRVQRRGQARRRGVQPAVRLRGRRRPADHVAALRRRRPRRLRPAGGLRQRRHRHHPDGRHALPPAPRPARTCRSRCCTPTSTRPPSRCAARCSTTSRSLPGATGARLVRARRGQHAAGRGARRDDGPRRRRSCRTTPLYYLCGPLPFMQAVRSALHRPGRARRATSSTRCSAPTSGRPTSSPRRRRAPRPHGAPEA